MSNVEWSVLPAVARSRVERARASGVATSLLSVPEQAGLDSCGFVVVGEVMGCTVTHVGFQGYGGCGWAPGYGLPPAYTITGRAGGFFGLAPYLDALRGSWDQALRRLIAECQALGGDGVVGIRFSERHLGEDNREYVALGTAVRSLGPTRPRVPFTTTLPGQDVAKLLHAGYVPVSALVAISLGIRHDDWQTRSAASMFAGNVEVPGYTDLVHTVRQDVRLALSARATAAGAAGVVLTSPMRLDIGELEAGENHRDHVAIATVQGTGIVRFGDGHPVAARPLAILPLDQAARGTGRRRGVATSQIEDRGAQP